MIEGEEKEMVKKLSEQEMKQPSVQSVAASSCGRENGREEEEH